MNLVQNQGPEKAESSFVKGQKHDKSCFNLPAITLERGGGGGGRLFYILDIEGSGDSSAYCMGNNIKKGILYMKLRQSLSQTQQEKQKCPQK